MQLSLPVTTAEIMLITLEMIAITRNEPHFLQLKKRWSNDLKLASKHRATVVWKAQALAIMLFFSQIPLSPTRVHATSSYKMMASLLQHTHLQLLRQGLMRLQFLFHQVPHVMSSFNLLLC